MSFEAKSQRVKTVALIKNSDIVFRMSYIANKRS
jgi:hypothetical protein